MQASIDAGARCLLGGELPTGDGLFYPVTLLVDLEPGMQCYEEETFGPVMSVVRAANWVPRVSTSSSMPSRSGSVDSRPFVELPSRRFQ